MLAHVNKFESYPVELVHSGTAVTRISLAKHADGSTRVLVDGIVVKEFRVASAPERLSHTV